MIIIAFDSSISSAGYAVIDTKISDLPSSLIESGTIRSKRESNLTEKVVLLGDYVSKLCKLYNPEAIIIEKAESFTYAKTTKYTGKGLNRAAMAKNNISVGVIAGIASQYCVNIVFVSAQDWKGMQRKEVTRMVVNNEYNLK